MIIIIINIIANICWVIINLPGILSHFIFTAPCSLAATNTSVLKIKKLKIKKLKKLPKITELVNVRLGS